MQRTLLQHDRARIRFQRKIRAGRYQATTRRDPQRARSRNRLLYSSPQSSKNALQNHLKRLDPKGKTFALVYDPQPGKTTIYLIGTDSLMIANRNLDNLPEDAKNIGASAFRSALNINQRSLSRRPRPRRGFVPDIPAEPKKHPIQNLNRLRQVLIPDELMKKIEAAATTLLILPAGDLSTVPFAALPSTQKGKDLLDFATPIILPSINALYFQKQLLRSFKKALIVGDPDLSRDKNFIFAPLPGARDEARYVARLLGSKALVGRRATHKTILKKLGKSHQLIYLATHGISDAKNPMDASFLALRGRHLRAAEIKKLRYTSYHPLVVMSACQTGLGKTFDAGIFGLARAWIAAGAAQVLASQWNVDDQATAFLMKQFMKKLKQNKNTARAFRHAMLATRNKYPDPAKWSSFNLFGYPQVQR
ncbi:MAG: CHAT domain-containing protein [Hyphomicrobiaceae bacterium]|nr:CHAT domain-containing protein [Hyphomicrobiaceae bacterium]